MVNLKLFNYFNKKIYSFFEKIYKYYKFEASNNKKTFALLLTFEFIFIKFKKKLTYIFIDKFKLNFSIDLETIEIEIITDCNLKCFNCNRSCKQAPSSEFMTVEQIQKFINESIKLKKKWREIRLLGGEPTLHNDIVEICHLLLEYKKNYAPKTLISLATNGYGDRVKEVLPKLPKNICIINALKDSNRQEFDSFNIASIDLEEFNDNNVDYSKGCLITHYAGMALTRYGYYPCGPAGSIDRVLNLDIGIKELKNISNNKFRNQLKVTCQYCGHFKNRSHYNAYKSIHSINNEQISPFWENAYKKYNQEKPELSLY